MNDFKKVVEENKELIIERTRDLIRIPSVLVEDLDNHEAPFGKEIRRALDFMLDMAKEDGFETYQDEGFAGHISYGTKGNQVVGILCHLDVVPEGKDWLYPPYEGKVVDNKLYGRGSGDDKGPTMAAYFALKFIKDAGIKLKNEVRIILGTDEETGWRGITHYLANNKAPDIGFAPDADFPLIYGEKGRMSYDLGSKEQLSEDDILVSLKGGERYNVVLEEVTAKVRKDITSEFVAYAKDNNLVYEVSTDDNYYVLTLKGVAAHAMEPFKGINAGTHMCNFLSTYSNYPLIKYVAKYHHESHFCEKLGLDYNDYEMGPITCNLGIMDIDNNSSRVTLDLRYPERTNIPFFEQRMEEITKENNVVITNHTNKNPHYVPKDDPLVEKLYAAYVKNTGDTVNKPFTIGGGTYASILKKAVAFGMLFPGEEELCHQRNEYINLDSLYTSILIYIDAILSLGEVDA